MRRVLYASAWLGPQAFQYASAFNANIGAWNTASMTTIDSVCALCHRLRVCLGLAWGAALGGVYAVGRGLQPCMLAAVLLSFLEHTSHTP
jgi:hypothetical protein